MSLSRRSLVGSAAAFPLAAAASLPGRRARAQGADTLRIGILTDMSGPYQDLAGPLAVKAAQLAAEDFGAAGGGLRVEVIGADHQNKADIGSGIARQWFDEGVALIAEGSNSAVALAVSGVARDKDKAFIDSGASTSDLTGVACNANTIHWAYDTYMMARSTGGTLVKAGGDSWFFISVDAAGGQALQRDTSGFVQQAGGKVLGSVRYPFPTTTDFSSLLLQAQSSGAKVLGLVNAGTDTINCVKQAQEFSITPGMKLAALTLFLTDVHSLGLQAAQGIVLTNSFYWDMNDRARAFSERFKPKAPTRRPTMVHAGVYASVLHYLKAASAMGVPQAKASGAATVERMKAMPTNDDCFGEGMIRLDGQKIHPSYLWEVKAPGESRYSYDYYKLLATTPADQAFRPLGQGGCTLVKP